MKKTIKENYIKTITTALVIVIGVMMYEGSYLPFSTYYLRLLSDGLFVSGMAILIIAVLCFVANEGGLYFIGYLKVRLQHKIQKREDKIKPYYQYVQDKKDQGKMVLSHMFVVSIIEILLSLLIALL